MKKLIQFIKSGFSRRLATPLPVVYTECIHQPSPDFELVRFSVWLHFRSRKSSGNYLLSYDPVYELIIDGLRFEGWMIQLHIGRSGELCYAISPARSGMYA